MFNYFRGKLTDILDGFVVVECGGVGFELAVSLNTMQKVGKIGDEVKLFSYLAVREDDLSLYGFIDRDERAIFVKLLNVSGIGPKLAITVLSSITPSEFALAIALNDIARLTRIKGLGKKKAEMMILELKGRVGVEELKPETLNYEGTMQGEAVMALVALGISQSEATTRVSKVIGECKNLQEVIFRALR